jgi:hypothetical protein
LGKPKSQRLDDLPRMRDAVLFWAPEAVIDAGFVGHLVEVVRDVRGIHLAAIRVGQPNV